MKTFSIHTNGRAVGVCPLIDNDMQKNILDNR